MVLQRSFTQSWLPEPELAFHPGTARISLNGAKLQFKAKLIQPKVGTSATSHQQRLWELGDVVELFVQRIGNSDYYEYQIAPNGMMLALHYPDREAVATVRSGERRMEEFLSDLPMEGNAIMTAVGWNASLSISLPHRILGKLRIHCGRYDYSFGVAPVVSSTAPLTKRDFHRFEEWQILE